MKLMDADCTCSHEEERQELARILRANEIARSANLVRMLNYICQCYFDGKTDEIRESSIAIHALGRRPGDFDSQADPIVRVTARTLRKRLEQYYREEGKDNPLRLTLPVGHYIPNFLHPAANNLEVMPALSAMRSEEPETPSRGQHGSVGISRTMGSGDSEKDLFFVPLETVRVSSGKRHLLGTRQKPWSAVFLLLCALLFGYYFGQKYHKKNQSSIELKNIWGNPLWSDEFNGEAGSLPNAANWNFDAGGKDKWGNGEDNVYCDPTAAVQQYPCSAKHPNAYLDGRGHLVLEASKMGSAPWTSARINTLNKKSWAYGRIEARIQFPTGAGLWPTFWMLGENWSVVPWPECGSISIAENVSSGKLPNMLGPSMIRSTLHGPGYSGANGIWQNYQFQNGRVDDGFHTYGLIWSPGMVQFYVDDPSNVYFVRTASEVPAGGKWVFDHPFAVVLNLAVGGDWPGPPTAATPNPAKMIVDYVRVYHPIPIAAPSISASEITVQSGDSASIPVRLHSLVGAGRVYVHCSGAPVHAQCIFQNPVADFTHGDSQTLNLLFLSEERAAGGWMQAARGRHSVQITATSVSGNTSTINVPVIIQ